MVAIYDVLKASKGIHVDDTFAELWGRKLSNAYTVATYHGTLPATLAGTMAGYLESYKIYGNTVQAGTPTPENPIMPSGCGVRTENLFNKNITVGIIPNAYINQSGRQVSSPNYYLSYPIPVEPNQDYTWSFNTGYNAVHTAPTVAFYDTNDTLLSVATHNNSIYWFNFTTPNDCAYIRASVYTAQANDTGQLLLGSKSGTGKEDLPYEPYGYKLPILSNSTVTNIYLGEVETTRRIKKLVLTGEETWTKRVYGNANYTFEHGLNARSLRGLCSHYARYASPQIDKIDGIYLNNTTAIIITDLRFTTPADFKSYLAAQYAAGTPVTVWYVLTEPETAVVNEPLMKIDDYADTIDSAQTSVQIPTAAGETTISWAGEGLAPSEVKLTYRKPKGQ